MTRRFRVLILGVGSIGERHLRCFQATGRADVSFVEPQPALRKSIAARYGVEHPSATLDEALTTLPDVAVIASPAPTHTPLAQTLADYGVHLLIEKPLSTGFDGLDHLAATIAERRLTVGVAYVLRHHPLLLAMRRAIHEGRIGRPVQLIAVTGQHFPTFRPAYREIYYARRESGGGAIQDALTHVVNAGEWLVGPVDRLAADAAHQVLDGVEVEDTAHLLVRHGPVLGSYSLGQHQAPNEFTLTVHGTAGTARFEMHAQRWRWMTEPNGTWHEETCEPFDRDRLFIDQANSFLDAVEHGTPPRCPLAEGWQTLRVNLAALASLERGDWQSIPSCGPKRILRGE